MKTRQLTLPCGWLAAIALMGLVCAAQAEIEDNLDRTFNVSPGGKFVLEADRGSVNLTVGNDKELEIKVLRTVTGATESTAKELFEDHEVAFSQEGNTVRVKAKFKHPMTHSKLWSPKFQVKYEVKLPREFNVEVHTAGGSIAVPDLKGEAELHTAGGSIKVGAVQGRVNAHTAGGSIAVEGATGPVTAETAGGGIRVVKTEGEVKASTAGGSIHIEGAKGAVKASTAGGGITATGIRHSLDAETSGGSITLALDGSPQEECKVQTTGGGITMVVSDKASLNLDARTVGGRVSTSIPVTVIGEQKSSSLQGTMNGGGKLVKLRTTGGGITIKTP
jgi:DUF4097 and DUF4098 domain-containing protein YvlB